MKKIFLIAFLLLSSLCYSQGEFYIGNSKVLKDSSTKTLAKKLFWFQNSTTQFGTSIGIIFDLRMGEDDQGGFSFKKNGSTSLFDWGGSDGDFFRFHYGLDVTGDVDITGDFKINGVPLSPGGGDAYLNGNNTWTDGNYFSDTLKANGQIWLNGPIQTTGTLISNLWFQKGANARFGTFDNYPLFIGANSDTAINVAANNNTYILKDLYIKNTQIAQGIIGSDPALFLRQKQFVVQTPSGFNIAIFDSTFGIARLTTGYIAADDISLTGTITAGDFEGDGSGITNLDASNISDGTLDNDRLESSVLTDSSLFFRVIAGITETVLSKVNFSDVVTFAVSPVFSAVVNFANGLTTTNMYASGFVQIGSTARLEKVVYKAFKITATGNLSIAHNIPDFKNITSLSFTIFHDTTTLARRRIYVPGSNLISTEAPSNNIWADTTYFWIALPAAATALIDDSLIFRAVYTNSY